MAMSLKEVEHLKKRGSILKYIEDQVPNFKVIKKDDSFLMKLLSFFLFFNKRFMTGYVTTIYPNIYVPSGWGERRKRWYNIELEILVHESVHLYDRKRLGWFFNILYLSPQIFALLALGAFWNLSFLLFLLFLLPLPSPGRTWLEFRGYRAGLLAKYWMLCNYNSDKEKYWSSIIGEIDWVMTQFNSSAYYYMFPFKSFVKKNFIKSLEDVKIRNILPPELREIKNILLG